MLQGVLYSISYPPRQIHGEITAVGKFAIFDAHNDDIRVAHDQNVAELLTLMFATRICVRPEGKERPLTNLVNQIFGRIHSRSNPSHLLVIVIVEQLCYYRLDGTDPARPVPFCCPHRLTISHTWNTLSQKCSNHRPRPSYKWNTMEHRGTGLQALFPLILSLSKDGNQAMCPGQKAPPTRSSPAA